MPPTPVAWSKTLLCRAFFAIGLALSLWSCGGGDGGQLAGGGIGGTGAALGPVAAKGSLSVNGVKFDTDNATADRIAIGAMALKAIGGEQPSGWRLRRDGGGKHCARHDHRAGRENMNHP